jgi:hypothetical protein
MARQPSTQSQKDLASKDATPSRGVTPMSRQSSNKSMPRQLSNNYHKGSLSTFYDEPEDTDKPEDQGNSAGAGAGQLVSIRSSPSFQSATDLEDTGLTSESDNDEQRDTASTADCDDGDAVQVTQEVSSDSDLDRTAPQGKTLCRQLSEQPRVRKCSEGDESWTIKSIARRQITDPMHNQRGKITQTMARRQITDPMPILKRSMKGSYQHNGSLSTFYD